MTKIAALVPMRHHSQRVPKKNYRYLGGKPLFHHIISTLLQVPEIDQICVNTDSPPIMDGLERYFPSVTVIDRPEELCADNISMNRIITHEISLIQAEYYLQTHSTNPLLSSETISGAIRFFLDNLEQYDSLFSVTRIQTRLYDGEGRAINHDPAELIQTQDLPPVFEENSCLYLFSEKSLLENNHRIGKKPCMYEIDSREAWDIDNPLDFRIVNYLIANSDG